MLADHLPPRSTTGKPCSVGIAITRMGDDDKATLQRWFADGLGDARIFAALTAEGHEVGMQTIGRHRRHQCNCVQA